MDAVKAVINDPSLVTFVGEMQTILNFSVDAFLSGPTAMTTFILAAAIIGCWLGNITTGYWSWVDRCWSTIPPAYILVYAYFAGVADQRVLAMASLATLWGLRLSFNFYRKGGYGHEEDYRWPIIRTFFQKYDPLHPLFQEFFNLSFVAFYQHVVIWLFCVPPVYLAYSAKGAVPLNALDFALIAAFLACLVGETWADEVQWAFQSKKHTMSQPERVQAGGDYALGFCTHGPFKYSRHLNYFCEQSIWWIFYGFSIAAGHPVVNWSCAGALLLCGIFQGSTWMTELLSVQKYPAYAAYQQTTSRLLPLWPLGPSLHSAEGQVLVKKALAAAGKKQA